MRVLFGVAGLDYQRKRKIYEEVERAIKSKGHTLYFEGQQATAIESADDGAHLAQEDWQILCQRELVAANDCEAAIFDVTNKAAFGVGSLASICLARQVPTQSLLSETSRRGSIISGLTHPSLIRRNFDVNNVAVIVGSFLQRAIK